MHYFSIDISIGNQASQTTNDTTQQDSVAILPDMQPSKEITQINGKIYSGISS
jgi:hypothetical protein